MIDKEPDCMKICDYATKDGVTKCMSCGKHIKKYNKDLKDILKPGTLENILKNGKNKK